MSASIKTEDTFWSEMLASSYTYYGAKRGQIPATLILGAYGVYIQKAFFSHLLNGFSTYLYTIIANIKTKVNATTE